MDTAFDFLDSVEPATLARCLAEEPALLAGVVLGRLSPPNAAKVLANMSAERQKEVVAKMGKSRAAPEEVVQRIAVTLRKKVAARLKQGGKEAPNLTTWQPRRDTESQPVNVPKRDNSSRREQAIKRTLDLARRKRDAKAAAAAKGFPSVEPADAGVTPIDGEAIAAGILRFVPQTLRMRLAEEEPELYQTLRKRMFIFDDLERSPADTLGLVFGKADTETIALALRFASPRLIARALGSISPRRADLIRDEMEASARGRVRLQDVEAAQQSVLDVALELQAAGRAIIDPQDPDLAG